MLSTFFFILLVAIAIFAAVVAMQPGDFRISRSTVISATPGKVFPLVNDFHKWENWSPWAKLDPAVVNTFEGPASGTGAIFRWSGNNKVGQGNMTITESRPRDLVLIRLEFLKPFKAVHAAEFNFKPQGNGTSVTWSMSGKNNFIGKAMGLIMNCEKMIGGQFEQGLASMKSLAEGNT